MLSFSRSLVLTHCTHTITLHVFHLLHWFASQVICISLTFRGLGNALLGLPSNAERVVVHPSAECISVAAGPAKPLGRTSVGCRGLR